MQPDMHEIIPGLFLGNRYAAGLTQSGETREQKKKELKKHGISHILCVSSIHHHYFPDDFTYLFLPIEDMQNIAHYLMPSFEWIDKALSKNEAVLVHCDAGVSRSATIVIAYLMKKFGYSYDEAFELVRSKRYFIQPHPSFEKQLRRFKPLDKFGDSNIQ